MPFCSQCGNQVGDADRFCGSCGVRQPSPLPPPHPVPEDPLAGISPKTLSILCYVPLMGWVASVIVLGARQFRGNLSLRFHAFQGLYLFAAWLLVDWAIEPIFISIPGHFLRPDHILKLALLAIWIVMIVKTYNGEEYSLPVVGELAHRSVHNR